MSAHKQKYEEQIQTTNQAHREYLMVRSDYIIALKELESLRAEKAELIEALRAIIAQWDTPNWKLTESTGTIINQARQTLAKYETK
jgi:hypothetical protein